MYREPINNTDNTENLKVSEDILKELKVLNSGVNSLALLMVNVLIILVAEKVSSDDSAARVLLKLMAMLTALVSLAKVAFSIAELVDSESDLDEDHDEFEDYDDIYEIDE